MSLHLKDSDKVSLGSRKHPIILNERHIIGSAIWNTNLSMW